LPLLALVTTCLPHDDPGPPGGGILASLIVATSGSFTHETCQMAPFGKEQFAWPFYYRLLG
jgi:hypothetical protein